MIYVYMVVDGVESILYSPTPSQPDEKILQPMLDMEVNRAGSLTFDIYPNNPLYPDIMNPLAEFIVRDVEAEDPELWRGRLYEIKDGFYKNKHITLEGELAYLQDSLQEPAEFKNVTPKEFLAALLKVHNKKMPAYKQFQLGRVTVTDDHSADSITKRVNKGSYTTSYSDKTFDKISSLISSVGGHLEIRWENGVRYLDYLKDYEKTTSQTIQFGVNLLDFSATWNISDLATVLVPVGTSVTTTDESGNSVSSNTLVSSVNNGSPYIINQTAAAQYGRREQCINFSGIIDPTILLAVGKKWLSDMQFDNMVLEINAVDLADLTDSAEPLRFLHRVHAVSAPHGMDKYFPVTKISLSLDDPSRNVYTMSTTAKPVKTMSTAITDHDQDMENALSGLADEIADIKKKVAAYNNSGAPLDDWIYGLVEIVFDKDDWRYKDDKIKLVHKEFVTRQYISDNEWFKQIGTSMGSSNKSYDTWVDSLFPDDESHNITFAPVPGYDTEVEGNIEPGSLEDQGELFMFKYYGYFNWFTPADSSSYVIYVVAKFREQYQDGSTTYTTAPTVIGRDSSFYYSNCGGIGVSPVAVGTYPANSLIWMNEYGTYGVSLGDSQMRVDVTERYYVFAQCFHVAPAVGDTYTNVLIIANGSSMLASHDAVGGLAPSDGNPSRYYLNVPSPDGYGESPAFTESAMSIKYIATCESAYGQITIQEVMDNVKGLAKTFNL